MPKDYDDFIYNLVSWTTFFFEWKSWDVSHFQVILNTEINNHTKLLFLSVSTTQISGRERFITSRNFDPRTLVIVEPWEVSFLPKRSGFHCNDPLPYDSYDLYGEYISWNLKYKWVLPQKIWTRF
jgi:hypothetical protein